MRGPLFVPPSGSSREMVCGRGGGDRTNSSGLVWRCWSRMGQGLSRRLSPTPAVNRFTVRSRRGRGTAATVFVALLLLATPARAVSDPAEMLANPAQEARAEQVGRQLRCLVCQNESIEDSNADLAKDLRAKVRGRIAAGDTDDAATAWVVARYGDFVRLRPPVTGTTALLWASPVLAVLAGLGFAFMARRRAPAAVAPLTETERQRLDSLTGP